MFSVGLQAATSLRSVNGLKQITINNNKKQIKSVNPIETKLEIKNNMNKHIGPSSQVSIAETLWTWFICAPLTQAKHIAPGFLICLGHQQDKLPGPPAIPGNRIAMQEPSGQSIKVSQEHLQSLSICIRAALEEGVAEELCNLVASVCLCSAFYFYFISN